MAHHGSLISAIALIAGFGLGLAVMARDDESAQSADVAPNATPSMTPRPQATSSFGISRRWMPSFDIGTQYAEDGAIEASAGGCGIGTSIVIVNEEAFGKTYRADEALEIEIAFEAPGCTMAGAKFYGYHARRSRWYEYHCADRECPDRVYSTLTVNPPVPLSDSNGVVSIRAESGPFPPPTLFTQPPVEGFRFCFVQVTLSDGVWGGTYYSEWFSDPCAIPTVSPNDRA